MSLLSIEWLSMTRPSNGSVYATRDNKNTWETQVSVIKFWKLTYYCPSSMTAFSCSDHSVAVMSQRNNSDSLPGQLCTARVCMQLYEE